MSSASSSLSLQTRAIVSSRVQQDRAPRPSFQPMQWLKFWFKPEVELKLHPDMLG